MEFLYLCWVIFSFSVFLKLADAHNEHWMVSFPWAWLFYWIIWGLIWWYLITYSQNFYTLYLILLLYRIYKIKIDYLNHAISRIIMFFFALSSNYIFNMEISLVILLSMIIIDYIKILNKTKWKNKIIERIYYIKPQFTLLLIIFIFYTNDFMVLAFFADFIARAFTIKIFNINQNKI